MMKKTDTKCLLCDWTYPLPEPMAVPFPDMEYKCILADPPWQYANKNTGGSMSSGAGNKYPTMPLDEICALPVHEIADTDSCLFLWATTPLLPEAFKVMEAWGFNYKTAIYWRKIMSMGLGFWFRGQVEVCLFGVRGKIKAFRCQSPNFIQTKVRKHSQKPDEMYGLIESLGIDPKIELFARNRRQGWDTWGNQVGDSCQTLIEEVDQ